MSNSSPGDNGARDERETSMQGNNGLFKEHLTVGKTIRGPQSVWDSVLYYEFNIMQVRS